MALDAERAASLARVKLERLVSDAFAEISAPAVSFNAGAALVDQGRAFVYLSSDRVSPIGAALAWGQRHEASELHVILDEPDPVLALAADGLGLDTTLWQAVETSLVPMPADTPLVPPAAPANESMAAAMATLTEAGCEVAERSGVVVGEIAGLEVARVVVDVHGEVDSIRVGVGVYDQEAHEVIHGDAPIELRLQQVIGEVRSHRHPDAAPHPLNRVARAGWLRSVAIADPALLGLDTLAAIDPLVEAKGIYDELPAAAIGATEDTDCLVVFSTGIDLDIVPAAAAHWSSLDRRPAEILLVLPERDHHPVIAAMAEGLRCPTRLAALADPWP